MRPSSLHRTDRYRRRLLACLALSLATVVGVLHLPSPLPEAGTPPVAGSAREVIALAEVRPTAQRRRPPPPPRPAPAVMPPEAVVLEDVALDLSDAVRLETTADPGTDADASPGADVGAAASAEVPPRALRFVVPEYTRAARRQGIRATVAVEVHIDARGRVREARILERTLLDAQGRAVDRVEALHYGLEESVLAAAQRWLFQPARRDGQPVEAVTTIRLDVGDARDG